MDNFNEIFRNIFGQKFQDGLRLSFRKVILAGIFMFIIFTVNFQQADAGACLVFVDSDANGDNSGTSWENAFVHLQDALDLANNASYTTVFEIWVAEGVYYPDQDTNGDHVNNSENESFYFKYDNVKMFGGFAGWENSRNDRMPHKNITILSGDIDNNDVNQDGNHVAESWTDIQGDNAFHVIYFDGESYEPIDDTAVVDGFFVTAGQANGSVPDEAGGGMYCAGSGDEAFCTPYLENVVFIGNMANWGGGAVFHNGYPASLNSGAIYTNVQFIGNKAEDGGAVMNYGYVGGVSQPTFVNTVFINNEAEGFGGAVYNEGYQGRAYSRMANVTFYGNEADRGGAIFNRGTDGLCTPSFTNVIMWGNKASYYEGSHQMYNLNATPLVSNSIIQGGLYGSGVVNDGDSEIEDYGGNIDSNPLFLDAENGDLTLSPQSPAIDAGRTSQVQILYDIYDLDDDGIRDEVIPFDLKYNPRIIYNQIDIGPYEAQMSTFTDVPPDYWAHDYIEALYQSGITGGCSTDPLMYCPSDVVSRAQMAVFLERGIHGSDYNPPAPTGLFDDVPVDYWAAKWIEALYNDGITGGCGGNNYCPGDPVTRAQMAVFLLRSEHGAAYDPPAATGVFNDVPVDHWAADWIEQLAAEGITSGCGGGNYCPEDSVTRDQMAVFLVRTFNLPIP